MMPHETIYGMADVPHNFHRLREVLLERVRRAAAKFDGAAFDRNRARIAQAYVRMFDAIGVNVSANVHTVAAGCSSNRQRTASLGAVNKRPKAQHGRGRKNSARP